MALMDLHDFINLHIEHSITIGHEERLVVHILLDAFDATTCHGVIAVIDHSHLPWIHIALMNSHPVLTITVIEGNIGVMQEIVDKPLFDILLLVTCLNYKLGMIIIGIPPITIMGLDLNWLSSLIREPKPPARRTIFI